MAPQSEVLDGFWIPSHLRHLLQHVEWETHGSPRPGTARCADRAHGSLKGNSQDNGVKVRWPVFDSGQW